MRRTDTTITPSGLYHLAVRAATRTYRDIRTLGISDTTALVDAEMAALVAIATPQQMADARGAAAQAVMTYANEHDAELAYDEG